MTTDNLENVPLKKWEAPQILESQMDDTESGFNPGFEGAHGGESTTRTSS
jgi:hypothetical protein